MSDSDGLTDLTLSRRDAIRGGAALGTLALASRIGAYAQVVEAQITEPRIQLGSDYAIHDSGGNLVINHDPNGDILEYDATADQITTLKSLSSVTTEGAVINDTYHWASQYDGADADARLDNALTAASAGDTIFLENATYSRSAINTGNNIHLIGTGGRDGTTFDSIVTISLQKSRISNCYFAAGVSDYCAKITTRELMFDHNYITSASDGLEVDAQEVDVIANKFRNNEILLTSNATDCVIDSNGVWSTSSAITITDNGSRNVIGDNS